MAQREYQLYIRLPLPADGDDERNVDRICGLLGGPTGLDGDDWDFGDETRDIPGDDEDDEKEED